jgi:hypothetical protein
MTAPLSSKDMEGGTETCRYLYGMRIDGLSLPRQGNGPSDWEWPVTDCIELVKPDFIEQPPEPTVMVPEGYTFPQAPMYIVNEHYDA